MNASAGAALDADTLTAQQYVEQVAKAVRNVPATLAAVPTPRDAPPLTDLAPVKDLADSLDDAAAALGAGDRAALEAAVAQVNAAYQALAQPAQELSRYGSSACLVAFQASAAGPGMPAGHLDLGGVTASI